MKNDLPQLESPLKEKQLDKLLPLFHEFLKAEHIPDNLDTEFEHIYLPLAHWLAQQHPDRFQVIGVNGAQGSGKSTISNMMQLILSNGYGKHVQVLSIDDLYLQPEERAQLADSIHPLFRTRGVPGTHDVQMGLDLLQRLKAHQPGERLQLPRFDKSLDRRHHDSAWTPVDRPLDILILEGWCVGALPQQQHELVDHVNELELKEDPEGHWRRAVNATLSEDYQRLFAELDVLIMMQVPSMDQVYRWRTLQESKLGDKASMDESALRRFIMHYERLTLAQLEEMPSRADVVLKLDESHQIRSVTVNPGNRAK